jgi:hypothetical protein
VKFSLRRKPQESPLVTYAREELERAGLFDPDSNYGGMLGPAALDIVKVFAGQGHSGASAEIVTQIAVRLMRFQPLTPLTFDPDEWIIHEGLGEQGAVLWQNRRKSTVFSDDQGTSWYDLDEPNCPRHLVVPA